MASVSVVTSSDFRANLSQPQNSAPDGEEPFSLLLNSVADVKANVQRPEVPKIAERRAETPAKQARPETDADREARRRVPDAEKPEADATTQASAPGKADAAEESEDDTNAESGGNDTAIDPLLLLAMGEPEQSTTVPAQLSVDANLTAEQAAAALLATDAEIAAPMQAATASAISDAGDASGETPALQAVQNTGPKPNFGPLSAPLQVDTEAEAASTNNLTEIALAKPLKAAVALDAKTQTQTQPGPVNVSTATPLQGPAPLEMLNAAISKHAKLSLGIEGAESKLDGQKPQVSSNAVAPNFALNAQVNATANVQGQPVAEAARAVPLESLAVEIATRANKGERRFDIRLDPPELGRIDVRLEIDSKGNTTTKLIVERSETLDLLQRDARGLEKALQNAGLKTDAGGLQFSLQQDAQTQQGQQNHAPEMRGRFDSTQVETEVITEIAAGNASLAAQIRGGVDIRI